MQPPFLQGGGEGIETPTKFSKRFSRNSAPAIISASLTFSSRALSLEDLLLLDLVLLELPELADFDPTFEDLFKECPCSVSASFSEL